LGTTPHRDEQQPVRGRFNNRLSDAARVGKVVEPGANHHANGPHQPVVRGTKGVAVKMGRRTNQGELAERTQRDAPVANLIAQEPELIAYSPGSNRDSAQEHRDRRGPLQRPGPVGVVLLCHQERF